jgi:GTPase
MYKASIVKVSASTLDGYSVGDEIGSESFQQWPNSYNAPFAIYANSTSITVRVDKNVQGFIQSGDGAKWDGSEIWTADMPNWRLKIVAIGNN